MTEPDRHELARVHRRWRAARRHLRALPPFESDPADVEALLARTVGLADAAPAGRAPRRRLPPLARARFLASAACLAVVGAGAWIWTQPARTPAVSEAELARIERDVDIALARLGRVLYETERITAIDVLGLNARQQDGSREATP